MIRYPGIRGLSNNAWNTKKEEENLYGQGFTDVKITEKDWFLVGFRGCDSGDAAKFVAAATNPRNETVQIYVCAGWPFKGATIRNK